jgi:hypothetical protein
MEKRTRIAGGKLKSTGLNLRMPLLRTYCFTGAALILPQKQEKKFMGKKKNQSLASSKNKVSFMNLRHA